MRTTDELVREAYSMTQARLPQEAQIAWLESLTPEEREALLVHIQRMLAQIACAVQPFLDTVAGAGRVLIDGIAACTTLDVIMPSMPLYMQRHRRGRWRQRINA